MQERHAGGSRTANGALRAVRRVDGDAAGSTEAATRVEPFDDVTDHDSAIHARGPIDETVPYAFDHASGEETADADANANEPLSPDDPLAPLPFNPYKGNRGLTRAWHAMKNSLAGVRVAIREESAFRQELTLAAILIPCGVVVPVEPVSRVLLLGSVLLVLIVELLNSSVEAAIDRISLERHELSRRAKDLGSAAVMVALGMCLMTWVLLVGPLVVHWIVAWL
ncbi:MAG TPA: diacylglycerol kinase [Paraburkholderia sp.]|jgi:diacylglycerol kinase (ATP)|nr:diacylglycerol kinase [Paraburkholderia sp.]